MLVIFLHRNKKTFHIIIVITIKEFSWTSKPGLLFEYFVKEENSLSNFSSRFSSDKILSVSELTYRFLLEKCFIDK
jgi:hypothetical protein